MPSYNPTSTKGVALEEASLDLITEGAVELAPFPSLGFYSRLFVVWKTSGSRHPVIYLLTLNRFKDVSHFQMETIQSVLLSVHPGEWIASINLREAHFQVPVHPESHPYLRFVALGHVYQFQALCFGLSMAPQVFTRVMAPVSAFLHSLGIHMRRYLDDWFVQSSCREALERDLQIVLDLCREQGIVVNPEKSNLVPSQVVQYLGAVLNTRSFTAYPSPDHVSSLLSTAAEFLSSAAPLAHIWLSLLEMLSSLAHLVPWDLQRWLSLPCLSQGTSLHQVSLDLDFGQTPQTSAGAPISAPRLLRAFGLRRSHVFPSTPGNSSRFIVASTTSSRLCRTGRLPCFATM